MADQTTPISTPATGNPTTGRRSPSRGAFPRFAISKVVPLVEAIWSEGHGEQVRATAAFARLNKAPNSGASRQLIAAANSGYGLITGNAGATYLGLTDEGSQLASSEGNNRTETIRLALFRNQIFAGVHARYLDKALPSDQVVSDFIRSEFGLTDDDAKSCWSVIQENLKFAQLLTREGNNDVIVNTPTQEEIPSEDSSSRTDGSKSRGDKTNHQDPASPFQKSPSVATDFHINVQIHLPGDASPETYDAIFASISKNLLGNSN